MRTRAAIIFEGNVRSESSSKGVPSTFLRILHQNLLETFRRLPSVEVILARFDRGKLTLITPDGSLVFRTPTLADQLTTATDWAFSTGFNQVLLVAADVAEVSKDVIASAFSTLESDEARSVVGPSGDGGFWLAGFNRHPTVIWSQTGLQTDLAASRLINQLQTCGLAVSCLEIIDDIDCRRDAFRVVRRLLRKGPRELQRRLSSALIPHEFIDVATLFRPYLFPALHPSGRAPPRS